MRIYNFCFLIILSLSVAFFSGCAVSRGGRYYKIQSGDTINSIAGKFNIPADEIVRINRISNPARIYAGSSLYIPARKKGTKTNAPQSKNSTDNQPVQQVSKVQSTRNNSAQPASSAARPKTASTEKAEPKPQKKIIKDYDFIWPVNGKIITYFSALTRGLTVEVEENSEVKAAAAGTVIYSGELKGYGNSIIIRHSEKYLSVYTYLKENKTAVEQAVKAGDTIAVAGITPETGFNQPVVHFEIRVAEGGNPVAVNPLIYLD